MFESVCSGRITRSRSDADAAEEHEPDHDGERPLRARREIAGPEQHEREDERGQPRDQR